MCVDTGESKMATLDPQLLGRAESLLLGFEELQARIQHLHTPRDSSFHVRPQHQHRDTRNTPLTSAHVAQRSFASSVGSAPSRVMSLATSVISDYPADSSLSAPQVSSIDMVSDSMLGRSVLSSANLSSGGLSVQGMIEASRLRQNSRMTSTAREGPSPNGRRPLPVRELQSGL